MSGSRSPEGPSEPSVRFGGKALIESRVPQTPRQTQSQRADHALCRGQWAPPSPKGQHNEFSRTKASHPGAWTRAGLFGTGALGASLGGAKAEEPLRLGGSNDFIRRRNRDPEKT